jgi:hypothetical protein
VARSERVVLVMILSGRGGHEIRHDLKATSNLPILMLATASRRRALWTPI